MSTMFVSCNLCCIQPVTVLMLVNFGFRYALVELGSDVSVRLVTEKLPLR